MLLRLVLALIVGAFVAPSSFAHRDYQEQDRRHYYGKLVGVPEYDDTFQEQAEAFCLAVDQTNNVTTEGFRNSVNHYVQWRATCVAPCVGSCDTDVEYERHCAYDEEYSTDLQACVPSGQDCAIHAGNTLSPPPIVESDLTHFTVPDNALLDLSSWGPYKRCLVKIQSVVPVQHNGNTCYNYTFFITGGYDVDYDEQVGIDPTITPEAVVPVQLYTSCDCPAGLTVVENTQTQEFDCVDLSQDPNQPDPGTGDNFDSDGIIAAIEGLKEEISQEQMDNLIGTLDSDTTLVTDTMGTEYTDFLNEESPFYASMLDGINDAVTDLFPSSQSCTNYTMNIDLLGITKSIVIDCSKFVWLKTVLAWFMYAWTIIYCYHVVMKPVGES